MGWVGVIEFRRWAELGLVQQVGAGEALVQSQVSDRSNSACAQMDRWVVGCDVGIHQHKTWLCQDQPQPAKVARSLAI